MKKSKGGKMNGNTGNLKKSTKVEDLNIDNIDISSKLENKKESSAQDPYQENWNNKELEGFGFVLTEEDKNKFGDPAEEERKRKEIADKEKEKRKTSNKIKKNLQKEERALKTKRFFARIKNFFTTSENYSALSSILDYLLNFATVIAMGYTGYVLIEYFIAGDMFMTLIGCLVLWVIIKLNEKIQ